MLSNLSECNILKGQKKRSKFKGGISFSSYCGPCMTLTSIFILKTVSSPMQHCHAPCCCAVYPVTTPAAISYHCVACPCWQLLQLPKEDVKVGSDAGCHFGSSSCYPSAIIECVIYEGPGLRHRCRICRINCLCNYPFICPCSRRSDGYKMMRLFAFIAIQLFRESGVFCSNNFVSPPESFVDLNRL